MSKWKVRAIEPGGQYDFADLPDWCSRLDDFELIACEWWEGTFADRDYAQHGTIEIKSPKGEIKRFEMEIEAVPQARAVEINW